MAKYKWPKTIPVLKPCQIHKGTMHGPNGKKCLLGWAMEVFDGYNVNEGSPRGDFYKAWQKLTETDKPYFWNDDPKTTKKQICEMWLKVCAELGYTEDCWE